MLRELHAYLLQIREEVLPKSAAGQAVNYALKNWQALTRYAEDGGLAIDNNHTERSLRGIAVGRNNWLFMGQRPGRRDDGDSAELCGIVRDGKSGSVRLVSGPDFADWGAVDAGAG